MNNFLIYKNGISLIIVLLILLITYDRFFSEKEIPKSNIIITDKKISDNDKIKTLTDTVWCENRKSKTSMKLVMSVIYNRAKEKTLNGFYNEAIKPYQFSCLNEKSILDNQLKNKKDIDMYISAKQIVVNYVYGNSKPIISAKFYYNPNKVKLPKHLLNKKLILSFENHNFY